MYELSPFTHASILCKPEQELVWWVTWPKQTVESIMASCDELLRHHPVFPALPKKFFEESYLSGNDVSQEEVDTLLAYAIPAVSPASGIVHSGVFTQSINIEAVGSDGEKLYMAENRKDKNPEWPRNHKVIGRSWAHSDMADMAFPYKYKLFLTIIQQSQF